MLYINNYMTICLMMVCSLLFSGASAENVSTVSVALCYATQPPIAQLEKFDWAVVDPDANFEPLNVSNNSPTIWLAYMSIGEVTPVRSYYKDIPSGWYVGYNTDWASYIINQTAPGWTEFFVDNMTTPLMKRGFKGFFLDTLDSYQLAVGTDAQRQEQQEGLAYTILALKTRYPNAILIFNRGFEIMPSANQAANMVAFESLCSGWNQAEQKFVTVNQNDRDWLLAQTQNIQTQYQLPVLSIDYCPPSNSTCVASTVQCIEQHQIIPYVTDPALQTVGVGPSNP